MILKAFSVTVLALSILLAASGCQNEDAVKNLPDVSHLKADVSLVRYDQLLFQLDTNRLTAEIAQLESLHPDFSTVYFQYILGIQKPWDSTGIYRDSMRNWLTDAYIRKLYDTTQIAFPQLSSLEKELEQGFRYLLYHFPDFKVPTIYTFVSGYNYAVVPPQINQTLGIGLDMFLGEQHTAYYSVLHFPRYFTRTLNAEHIAAKVFDGLLEARYSGVAHGDRLLDYMVARGKHFYMLEQVAPHLPSYLRWGFTPDQMRWIRQNERLMWGEVFVKNNRLYDADYRAFRKLVEPSPHSPDMPEDAPGNTGSYIGYRIVQAYMERFPNTTFDQLMQLTDAQKLLTDSQYRPRRK